MRETIGSILIILYLLGVAGVIDFELCIGKPGHCNKPTVSQPKVST